MPPLQACMPSSHVCSNFESPTSPHLLYQAPPRAQQLSLPVFSIVPHLEHAGLNVPLLVGAMSGVVPVGFEHIIIRNQPQINEQNTKAEENTSHTCAGLDALDPCVGEIRQPAFVVPSTTVSTAAEFAGFCDGAALGACGTDCRCDWLCLSRYC